MSTPPIEIGNLFGAVPKDLQAEFIETLASGSGVRVERIVSHGHCSSADFWYDQSESEWGVVLSGEAKLIFEGEADPVHLKPGDHVTIPAGRRHRVQWTTPAEPTVWIAVFYR